MNLKDGYAYTLKLMPKNGLKGIPRKVLIRSICDTENLKEGDIGIPVVGIFRVADFRL